MRALIPLLAVLPAMLVVAAQLLPSLELNGLGLRTGGLDYRQAVSFSLRPRLLLQSLLPPFGGGLAEAFASEGYAEFVAYVGITGLLLAGVAVIRLAASRGTPRRAPVEESKSAWGAPLLLTIAGLFLALGAYNPLYYVAWRLIPGFDSFRAPVRWLELTAIGLAVLAALGLDQIGLRDANGRVAPGARVRGWTRIRTGQPVRIAAIVLVLGLAVLLAVQQWPAAQTVLLWLAVGALAAGSRMGRAAPAAARPGRAWSLSPSSSCGWPVEPCRSPWRQRRMRSACATRRPPCWRRLKANPPPDVTASSACPISATIPATCRRCET